MEEAQVEGNARRVGGEGDGMSRCERRAGTELPQVERPGAYPLRASGVGGPRLGARGRIRRPIAGADAAMPRTEVRSGRDGGCNRSSGRSLIRREVRRRLVAASRGHARITAGMRRFRSRTLRAGRGNIRRDQRAEDRSECDPRSTPSSKRNGHEPTPNGQVLSRNHRARSPLTTPG
jgi:hypothetical protein